jgi:mucin-19
VIQPKTATTTVGIGSAITSTSCGGAVCALAIDDTELAFLPGTFSGITLGSATGTGAMAINTAYTFTDPLTIRSNTGTITATSALNTGSNSLTISSSGAVAVAAITSGTLAITGTGITLNGDITTSGTQTYTGAVTLGNSITLASTGASSTGNNISFSSTVAGARVLTITAGTGMVTFSSTVGAGTALMRLDVTSSHATGISLNGDVTTTGTQIYRGIVDIGTALSISTTNSDITFQSDINLSGSLTISGGAGNIYLTGNVTGGTGTTLSQAAYQASIVSSSPLLYLPLTDAINSSTASNLGSLGGSATYSIANSSGGPGRATGMFDGTTALYVPGSSYVTYPNNSSMNPASGAFSVVAWVKNNGSGGIIWNKEDQYEIAIQNNRIEWAIYNTSPGWTWISANTYTPSTTAWTQIVFTSSGSSVNVYANGAVIQSNYAVSGPIAVGAYGFMIGQRGNLNQTFNGAIANVAYYNSVLSAATVLSQYQAGTTGAGSAINLSITGATINTSGATINTSGSQTYSGAVVIGTALTATTSNNKVEFNSTVNSTDSNARGLTVTTGSGNVTFTGAIGGATNGALGALAVNSTGTTTFSAAVTAASVTTNTGGTTAINSGSINTTSGQTYNDAVTLGAITTLASSSSGAINFVSTINGAYGLTVNTSGTTTFGGIVGGTTNLTSITTDAGGTTVINGGSITTSSTQTYNDALTIGAATTLSASSITTGSTVAASANNLTLTTDAISIGGAISGTGVLVIQPKTATTTVGIGSAITSTSCGGAVCALAIDDTELAFLPGTFSGITLGSATGTGAMAINTAYTFTDPLTIRSNTGTITATSALNTGTNSLTISSSGAVAVAAITSGTLAITGTGITLNGDITTSGTQTYTGAVTLGNSITLASTGASSTGNNISFSSTVNGTSANTQALTINSGSSGTISVSGAIGTTSLSTLTITNSGGATFSGSVSTGTSIVILNTSSSTLAAFDGSLTTPTLTVTGTANTYNVRLIGATNSVTNSVTFANAGTLVLGDAATDSFTFSYGVTATAPSSVTLAGAFTSGGIVSIGDSNTGITLADNTSITTAAANTEITLGGAITGASKSLTLDAGTSTITFGSTASGLGNTSLTANEINLSGSFAGTGTLSFTPSTTSRGTHLGSTDNSNATVLNLTTIELGYLADGFTSITIGSGTYSGDITSQAALSFKDPTIFTSTGTFYLGHNLSAASSTNASFTVNGPLSWTAGDITTGTGIINIAGDIVLGGSDTRAISSSSGVVTVGASTANVVTGNALNLTINSGSATATVNSALNGIGVLSLGTSSSQSGVITLNGIFSSSSLTVGSYAYDLVFNGGNEGTSTVTNAVTLSNTGSVTIGNQAGDIFVFAGGLSSITQPTLNLAGTLRAAGTAITLGNSSSTAYIAADTTIDTTNNGANPTGATISLAGSVMSLGSGSALLASDWTNGHSYDLGAWGTVIGLYGSGDNEISKTFSLGGASSVFTFNFYRLDTWDNEKFRVYANGTLIIDQSYSFGSFISNVVSGTTSGYAWSITPWVGDTSGNKAHLQWDDQRFSVSITTPSGISSLPIRINSNLNGGSGWNVTNDEAWAISSFQNTISATSGLSLNSGTSGQISSSAGLGSGGSLKFLSITNSGGATFSGAVNVSNAVTLTNTTSASTVAFSGGLVAGSLVTTANPYNVSITGTGNTITAATEFLNTGTLTLGNTSSGSITFGAGLTATAPSAINLAGTITSNGTTIIGDSNTSITLTASTSINTSGGASGSRNLSLGGAVRLSGLYDQALTLISGTGVLTTAQIGESLPIGSGAISITADEFNPTANIYGGSTLIVRPYTSGNTMVLGDLDSTNNNSDTKLDLTVTELAYLNTLGHGNVTYSGVTFGSATTGAISTVSDLSFKSPVSFNTNGAAIYLGGNLTGNGYTGGFTFNNAVAVTATSITVATANQAITFNSTLDGTTRYGQSLSLDVGSGSVTFNGAIGGTYDLNVFTLAGTGTYTINAPVRTSSIVTGLGGTTVIDTPVVNTVGEQSFNNAVLIKQSTAFSTTNANITFGSTVNTHSTATTPTVSIDSGSATTTFNGAVGGGKVLGATSITAGSVVTGSGGTIAMGDNALSITTDAISIGGAMSGTGTLTIAPKTTSTTIGLAGASGTLNLDTTELNFLSDGFSAMTIGSAAATGKITVAEYTFKDRLTLINGGATSNGGMQFTGAVSVLGGTSGSSNVLTLNSRGTVTQNSGAGLTAYGLELLGAGATYTLTDSANAITNLAGSTGTVSFTENSGFDIGTVGSTSGLTTTVKTTLSSTGTVTQSQLISTPSLELLGTAGIYTLTNTSNAITTLAANTGTVSFTENSGFDIGTVNSTSGLTTTVITSLSSTGTVTQSQLISSPSLELLGTGGVYALNNTSNTITTLAGNTGAVSLIANSGFDIGTVNSTNGLTTTGDTTLSSTGTVSQSQKIAAAGLELLGIDGIYTLTNTANAITTLAANTGSLEFLENSGFTVGTVNTVGITTTGNLSLSSTGGMTFAANISSGNGNQIFTGPITLNEDITHTTTGGYVMFNGSTTTINSIYVSNNPTVTFYTEYNGTGIANTWTGLKPAGTYVNNNSCDMCAWSVNDAISSVIVGGGTVMTLYQHGGLDGWSQVFNNSAGNTSQTYNLPYGSAVDNDASSFTVSGGGLSTANKTLTISSGAGDVTFQGAVGSGTNGTLGAITVNSSGITKFSATVNSISVETNSAGSTTLGASITTSSTQTYRDPVTLSSAVTLNSSSGNGSILFSTTVDGDGVSARAATINSGSGNVTFTGAVGGSQGLGNISLTGTGTTSFSSTVRAASLIQNSTSGTTAINGASIDTTGGAQTYNNAVTLGGSTDKTLTGTTVTFNDTVSGSYGLTITGNAVFGNGTADTVTLSGTSKNLSVSGATSIYTNGITTSGTQTYTGAVTVAAATTLSASAITTGSTVTANANNLTLTTDAISIGGAMSGTGTLTIAPKTTSTTIGLAGASGTLNLDTTELNFLSDGFSAMTIGSAAATGKITVAEYTFKDRLTLINGGATSNGGMQFTGAVSVLGGTSGTSNVLTLNSRGTVTQNSGAGLTAYGLELLGAGATYTLTDSANVITNLAGSTGTVAFIENTGFDIGTVGSTSGLTTTVKTTLSSTGTVTQSQLISTPSLELLGTAGIYTLTNTSNAITTLAANTGVLSFAQNTAYTVGTVSTVGITTTGNLALSGTAGFTISRDITSGAGTQTYTGPITLSTNQINLTSTDALISFSGSTTKINGAQALVINSGSGSISFGGLVGDTTPVSSLTLQGTGSNTLPGSIRAVGAIDLKGTSRTNTLVATTTLTSDSTGTITLGNTNGAYALNISNGAGTIDLAALGQSTALASLTLYGTGVNQLRGSITTTGAIDLKGTSRTTQLFFSPTISTTNSNVTIGTVDGGTGTAAGTYSLNISNGSGTITLGNVGATIALYELTLAGTGNTVVGSLNTTYRYNLGANRGLTLSADTTYVNPSDAVVLGNITLTDGVTLTLGNGGPATISINSIAGTAGGTASYIVINSVGTVAVTTTIGTDIGTLTITNSGGTTFGGAVDAATVTLTNTTGTIAFNGALTATTLNTANQAYNLALNASTGTITNAVTFSNSGTLALGASGGTLTFNGGFTASAPSASTLKGTISSSNDAITFGPITLGADATINTNATTINVADLSIGAVTGAGFNLTLATGAYAGAEIAGSSVSGRWHSNHYTLRWHDL